MPTYTYECQRCSSTFERFHAINAKPRVKCPQCGGACNRLIGSGGSLVFKGTGFYETDYKKRGDGKRKTPSADKADSGSSSEAREKTKGGETGTSASAASDSKKS